MATFVLVHGACFDSSCWNRVMTFLEQAEHRTIAPDLPGHGADKTPVSEISLASYTERIGHIVAAQAEPVVLVGHSMGGTVISQVAELHPDKVYQLIYVAGFLLKNGQSLFEVASQDTASLIGPNTIIRQDAGVAEIKPEALVEIFMADAPEAIAREAVTHVRPEPLAPPSTPIAVSAAHFGRIPRAYITTLQDKAISPETQQQMLTATPCHPVFSLNSSHSPFFSQPEQLAALLISLA